MTKNTPEEEIAHLEDTLSSLAKAMVDTRRQLEALRDKAGEGIIETGEIDRTLRDTNKLIVAFTQTETRLNEARNKQAGIARGGYALDMDRARSEIGCKLDQLRRCCGAGGVPV